MGATANLKMKAAHSDESIYLIEGNAGEMGEQKSRVKAVPPTVTNIGTGNGGEFTPVRRKRETLITLLK